MNKEQVELVINSICNNDLNSIKEFVNANKDQIDSVTTFGTMLQIASREGKMDIAKYLIDSGADVNIGGGFADSAMIDAVVQGHFDMVKLLLSHGAILDTSTFAANALFAAISGGYLDIAKYLINQGIDLTAAYHIGKIENCVQAVTNFNNPKLLAELSEDLGEAMVGINENEIKIIMEERGK